MPTPACQGTDDSTLVPFSSMSCPGAWLGTVTAWELHGGFHLDMKPTVTPAASPQRTARHWAELGCLSNVSGQSEFSILIQHLALVLEELEFWPWKSTPLWHSCGLDSKVILKSRK